MAIGLREQAVERLVVTQQPVGILKKALARHGKKLRRALGGVVVKGNAAALIEQLVKPAATDCNRFLPATATGLQKRHAIDFTAEQIDQMRTLMDYHAAGTVS